MSVSETSVASLRGKAIATSAISGNLSQSAPVFRSQLYFRLHRGDAGGVVLGTLASFWLLSLGTVTRRCCGGIPML